MSRIFIVDDHAMMRDGLRAVLEAAGHTVVGESGELTEALAGVVRAAPDVLLLDLHLGTRSGLELLAELGRRDVAVRAIVLTMSAQPGHVADALRLGAAGYLLKGAPSRDLLAAVDDVLAGRRHLGAGVADLAVRGLIDADADPLARLSPRERQIIVFVARGRSSTQIGEALHLSPKTVDTYRARLMAKLGLADVAALVRFAMKHGLVDADGN